MEGSLYVCWEWLWEFLTNKIYIGMDHKKTEVLKYSDPK